MIRPYRPADRADVERICMESGLRGHLDDYFCDRELFAKIWLGPFLQNESDTCWVDEENGNVVGYLVSAVKPGYKGRALRVLAPLALTMLGRWLTGKYRHHPPSGRFVQWFLLRSWREAPRGEASNFHFNVDPSYRGSERIGDDLMNAYFDHLRSQGVDRFQIHVFASAGKRDLQFYLNLGFRIADLRRCTVFSEPTLVVALAREVPDRVDWQKCRDRNRPKVSVIVTGTPTSPGLYGDLNGQALPADEVFVVGSVDDRAPGKVRHVPGGVPKALAQATGDTIVFIDPAVRVSFDLVAQVAAARARKIECGVAQGDGVSFVAREFLTMKDATDPHNAFALHRQTRKWCVLPTRVSSSRQDAPADFPATRTSA